MAELKTRLNSTSVTTFLNKIADDSKRADCFTISKIMESITKDKPSMWGTAIVGFGSYTYTYANGKSAQWMMMGFSPRKTNISLYIIGCNLESSTYKDGILIRLGKHKTGKSCLYINKLSDINIEVLKELCEISYQQLKKQL